METGQSEKRSLLRSALMVPVELIKLVLNTIIRIIWWLVPMPIKKWLIGRINWLEKKELFVGDNLDKLFTGSLLVTVLGITADLLAHFFRWVSDDEGFATPFHALFGMGAGLFALSLLIPAIIGMRKGKTLEESLPPGYLGAFMAVPGFFVAFAFDAFWHGLFGVEIGPEAIVSPSHLGIMVALFTLLATNWRSMSRRSPQGTVWTWSNAWPAMVSIIATGLFTVAILYHGNSSLTQYRMYNPPEVGRMWFFVDVPTGEYLLANATEALKQHSVIPTMEALFVNTFLMITALYTFGSRYVLPTGFTWGRIRIKASFWVILAICTNLHALMYGQFVMIPVVAVAASITAIVLHRLRYRESLTRLRLASFLMPFSFNVVLMSFSLFLGNWWPIWVTLSIPLVAGVTGLVVGLVMKPPHLLLQANLKSYAIFILVFTVVVLAVPYANSTMNDRLVRSERTMAEVFQFSPAVTEVMMVDWMKEMRVIAFLLASMSAIVTSFLLLVPIFTIGRHHRLPLGSWVVVTGLIALPAMLTGQIQVVIASLVAGVVIELLTKPLNYQRNELHLRIITILIPVVFHIYMMIVFHVTSAGNSWWTSHVWLGIPTFAGMIGWLIGFCAQPPVHMQAEIPEVPAVAPEVQETVVVS